MRHSIKLLVLLIGETAFADDKPNVIWVIVDDMSANFSCYGEKTMSTPHVDQLSKDGTRFRKPFVTAPVCSACRSALITGCYQTTIGAHHHRSGKWHLDSAGRTKDEDESKALDPNLAPHTPMEFPNPWIDRVAKDLPRERRSALALIAAIDDGVGRLRKQLKEMGQEENTLVFMLGDNGAQFGKRGNGSINLPMLGKNGMLSEGGIRVPFVAAWPGKIPGGQVFDHSVISLDIAATAIASAGQPAAPELDGVNLMPYFTGQNKEPPHKTLYWRWVDQAAIQEFPYKLILLSRNKSMRFDITKPEGEDHTHELSAKHPEIAKGLGAKLDTWLATLTRPGPPSRLIRDEDYIEAGILPGKEK